MTTTTETLTPEQYREAAEVLRDAASLLAVQGWTRGAMQRATGCLCAAGAILTASPDALSPTQWAFKSLPEEDDRTPGFVAFAEYLVEKRHSLAMPVEPTAGWTVQTIAYWNDHRAIDIDQVCATLCDAAVWAEERAA